MAKSTGTNPAQKRPATADHLRKRGRPYEDVGVCVDEGAVHTLVQAQAELDAFEVSAESEDTARKAELQQGVADAQELVDEATVTIRVESIGRKAYRDLLDAHPPTDEQNAEHRQEQTEALIKSGVSPTEALELVTDAPYNADTFPTALLAASNKNDLTAADIDELFDDWNLNEFIVLWSAAMRVHNVSRVNHWGKVYG